MNECLFLNYLEMFSSRSFVWIMIIQTKTSNDIQLKCYCTINTSMSFQIMSNLIDVNHFIPSKRLSFICHWILPLEHMINGFLILSLSIVRDEINRFSLSLWKVLGWVEGVGANLSWFSREVSTTGTDMLQLLVDVRNKCFHSFYL